MVDPCRCFGAVEIIAALGLQDFWGLIKLVVIAGIWFASTNWIDRDARIVQVDRRLWNLVSLLIGGTLSVWAFFNGHGLLPLVVVGSAIECVLYVFVRNRVVPKERRLLTMAHMQRILIRLKLINPGESFVEEANAVKIVLRKKDGTPATVLGHAIDGSGSSQALNTFGALVEKAIRMNATDIHLEPKEDELHVRFRVDGMLYAVETFVDDRARTVVSAAKVLSDMDIAERRRPQDGTFSASLGTVHYDVRVASGPTNYGEKLVLRLLNSSGGVVKDGLGRIGMRDSMLKNLRSIIHRPNGMFVVCGPTGAGKTSTLYAALGEIDALQRNITTIEDPIEYRFANVSQIAVNTAAELTFGKILRSVLRQDPDVIMVGEIRDRETAEIAMQAALTGHFVFTTLHANDTVATITRLVDIGLEMTLIQTALSAVLAQRLTRVLCKKCREQYVPEDDFFRELGLRPGFVPHIYREKGCPSCLESGFKGRSGVFELMVLNDEIKDLLVGRPSILAIKKVAKKFGMRTLQEDGMRKVIAGITSINEVHRVAGS